MSIQSLVADVRAWLGRGPKSFYKHHLEAAQIMTDSEIADVVRFAKSPTGARMALTHHFRSQYHV